jgi:hypothetical protein
MLLRLSSILWGPFWGIPWNRQVPLSEFILLPFDSI